ncbi:1-aminocyclopropane-1-carboxylate deaminase (plasmid) [Mycolicibacterium chubuense NBB4]|uniref:1-aminocyclopropane-1-carboxylate deaminase n=2 Tax=Mycolicibacterium chubuense TaxID=1800 RepID=I4BTG0_MYCCN|nr:1-aminocyclopropane-1-carboxylate deaminase [Mycolicibacterium chubuense NBB4]
MNRTYLMADVVDVGTAPLPRVAFVREPTPLHQAARLSDALGVEVWFKRDDLTGIGLGGNKLRGLEYLIADALTQGCDSLVTGAGPQSNWAMLAALTARQVGIEPYLVHYGPPTVATGNLLLIDLIKVDRRFTGSPDRTSVDDEMVRLCNNLVASGRKPYAIPRGGASSRGAAGYVRAGIELDHQWREFGAAPSQIWLPTGSCTTHAGLVTAARWLGWSAEIVGVTVSRPSGECTERIEEISASCASLLDITTPADRPIQVIDGYIGPGYGIASPAGNAAAALVAELEGIFLDPLFGAKAMAALIDAAHEGRVSGPVVFLATGGAPTLFAAGKVFV